MRERGQQLGTERRRAGLAVLGRDIVMHQRPFARPKNRDRLAPKRNPVLAAGGDALTLELGILGLRASRAGYHEMRDRWTADKNTVFPMGTWWVVQRAGASIAA